MSGDRQPTLGVHLLETITRGMYSEPLHCIREYVQNAYDGIRDARRKGILGADEGTVEIIVDEEERRLKICDDGIGLEPEEAAVCLLDIGHSLKARSTVDASLNAGFRGIGRMAGISYCRTLRFETSNGDGRKGVVTFDAAGINRLTSKGREPTTIIAAIEQNSGIEDRPEKQGRRYLEVTLEGVDSDSVFFDQSRLKSYLAQNAPVPYDPTKWSFGGKISDIAVRAGSVSSLDTIRMFLCDPEGNRVDDVRRPFQDSFQARTNKGRKTPTIRVKDVVALPRGRSGDCGWWGWIAMHDRPGALADAPFAGLHVRSHNIAIGDDSIARRLFTSPHLSRWCFGEIHITESSISPNSQRDNFEPSDMWDRIERELCEEVRIIEKEIRQESKQRNTSVERYEQETSRTIRSAKQAIDAGVVSYEHKARIIDDLNTLEKKLSDQESQPKRSDQEKFRFAELRGEVGKTIEQVKLISRTKTDDAFAHLDRSARRAIRIVFGVLKVELDSDKFEAIQIKIQEALKPKKGRR